MLALINYFLYNLIKILVYLKIIILLTFFITRFLFSSIFLLQGENIDKIKTIDTNQFTLNNSILIKFNTTVIYPGFFFFLWGMLINNISYYIKTIRTTK